MSSRPVADVLNDIIPLCIAETFVDGNRKATLGEDNTYTIETAMRSELLHIGADGCIVVPPVLLSNMHNDGETIHSCRVVVLRSLIGVMSHRDNESLYLSVVIHRLKAAVISKRKACPCPRS